MNLLKDKKNIRYAIVEDNKNFRTTIIELLKVRPDTGNILEFVSAEEALKSKSLFSIDFLIVDYRLEGMNGITFLGQPSIKELQIPKLILTGYNAESKIFDALTYGATGYMFKEDIYSLGVIIDILLVGGAYISPSIALIVTNYFKELGNELPHHSEILTEREEEVLQELSNGYSPNEISEKMSLSIYTIRTHIRNIYKKLEVSNQVQLLKKANEKKIF